MSENSKCTLFCARDEIVYHIISDYRKLTQKECKRRHDWVGKVIYWELCKRLKFDHTGNLIILTNCMYMHRPKSVLKNEAHENLWDFDIVSLLVWVFMAYQPLKVI